MSTSGRTTTFAQKGKELVPAARTFAINSYTNVLDRFSALQSVTLERWDFIITMAGVFVAISQLNHEPVSEAVKDAARDAASQGANERSPHALGAIEDCTQFVDRTYDGLQTLPEYKAHPEFLFSDALGAWVIWNLFDHAPASAEEGQLTRVIGAMLVHTFKPWWEST